MKAMQLLAHGIPGRMELRQMPDPVPREGEVVVRVKACGLNHLDLWLEEGGLPMPITLPRTPGSEIAGEIVALSPDIVDWAVGDRVAVQSNLYCNQCEFCLEGQESLCLNSRLLGIQCDGGFAELVVVPELALVRLPDSLSEESSAALTLAASTAMHMLTDRTQVQPGERVLVVGASSGVGSAAIQIAKQLGAQVITTGSTAEKRALGLQLGADYAVDSSSPDWAAEVRRLTKKQGVDLVVEHVGGEVLLQAFYCLARNGTVVTCGATAGREVLLNLWPFFVKQQRLIGSYGRNRKDLVTTLDWAAQGKIRPVIHHTYSLAETPAAFAALRERRVLGKLLIQP